MKYLFLAHGIGIVLFATLIKLMAAPGQLTWWEPWLVASVAVGITLLPWWSGLRTHENS